MSCRMRQWNQNAVGLRVLQCGVILLIALTWSLSIFAAEKITSIDFKGTTDPNEISIQTSGPVEFEKQDNAQDKQIILEVKGVTISAENSKKIDTSSFNSKVSLISPYQVENQPDTVRVVVQLRENAPTEVVQEGNNIRIKIPLGSSSSSAASQSETAPNGTATTESQSPSNTDPNAHDTSKPGNLSDSKTILDEFTNSKSNQNYIGKPITLNVRDVDIGDVLRLIGEASGFSVILGDDVKGKLTLSLADVPWDQALDLILHSNRLGAERHNNILRIATLRTLSEEKQEEFLSEQIAKINSPRVTRVFPISYANLDELQKTLIKFAASGASSSISLNSSGSTGGAANSTNTPSSSVSPNTTFVQADARTNSLIIRDLPENVEKMKKLIEILDTQTPQVIIEAKIVEASEGFSKALGGQLGVGGNTLFASFAGGNPIDAMIGTPGVFANGALIGQTSAPAGGSPLGLFGFSPNVSFIPGMTKLNALLNWGESENQVKVVSSPKTVVLNKQTAQIVEGTPVLIPTQAISQTGTLVPLTTVDNANIGLNVVPTITNDGSVLMDLKISRDVPVPLGSGKGIGKRNLATQVIVESGSTLVIGGIYTMQTSHTASGFPILRKIPILGALFGAESDETDRSELFIFITPRILNPKEAGLST